MTTAQHRLLSRLYQDLAELHENPYPGVVVFTDDANLRKFCLVLIPPSGPWKDLALHFDVELPEQWPSSPPRVASSVHDIDHPNLFGSYICCDLLKPQEAYHYGAGYTGGYSPALTLRGLFLQFLTFFSSTKVEQEYGGVVEIGDHTLTNYMKESEMVQRSVMPWEGCCRNQHLCSCGGLKNDQLALERLWKANNTPETKLAEYSIPGAVVHTTKGSTAHPDRLHKFEQPNPRWSSTLSQISRWQCKRCPYGSEDFPHLQRGLEMVPKDDSYLFALSRPPTVCRLGMLNDDILTEIASQLTSESLISFGKAYPRFRGIVSSHHILLSRELRCFFLRIPLRDCILGVGVAFDEGPRVLSSDFDWLSMEAFNCHNVRRSVEKRAFEYFLPLAFNRAHFERAHNSIWSHLITLDNDVRAVEERIQAKHNKNSRAGLPAPRQPHESVGIIYKMMNNIVVSLMKSCDDVLITSRPRSGYAQPTLLHASEKAVISYCHLFHLLLCLCRTNPLIFRDATSRLGRFIHNPASRIKAQVPDLGELIVLVMLVLILPSVDKGPPITWAILNGPFLEEAIIRNVRWVLKDAPQLEVLEQGVCEYRLATTFSKSKTSLRLMMFQITFVDLFIKTYGQIGISRLDENYGFAEPDLPESMVDEIKEIYKVETWPAFFGRVRYARGLQFTKEKFSELLRQAVRTSSERGYHSRSRDMHNLQVTRKQLERAWLNAQNQRC